MAVTEQAVILAGGLGTRLGELTRAVPKPLLTVNDAPFLAHLINNLRRFGFTDIVILVGYFSEQFTPLTVPGRFGEVTVRLSVEPPSLLGTAGALVQAASLLAESFVLLNGDTIFDINLLDLTHGFAESTALARLALRPQSSEGRYGSVSLVPPRVTGFGAEGSLINGGIYAMKRQLLATIGTIPASIERDVFPSLAAQGLLEGRAYQAAFLDIGVPDDLARADAFLRAVCRRPAAFLDRDGVLHLDSGYVHRPDDLIWVEGAKRAVKRLNDAGFHVFVVTNQAGVARGGFDCSQVEALHRQMNTELREVGAHVDGFAHCPFHPENVVPAFRDQSRRRKPDPSMIEALLAVWPTVLGESFLIGGREADLAAAAAASIRGYRFPGGNLENFVECLLAQQGT